MLRRFAWVSFLVLGCANGSELAATTGIGDEGEGGGYGRGGSGAVGGEDGDDGPTSTGTNSGSGGFGGDPGSGGADVGGAGVGGGGTGGAPPMCDFGSPNLCASSTQLNGVSGDEGGTATATGNTSKWFAVHVTEDDSAIFETDLSYTVTLQSPPGMVYDLFVHEGPQDGGQNCNAAAKAGTPSGGATQSVHASWDDDQGVGGEDDSMWLNIEVVWVSGDDCNASWTLTVTGDT